MKELNLREMLQEYGDHIVAFICGFVAVHTCGSVHCHLLTQVDSLQHVVYSLDAGTIEFLKWIGTTLMGFAGSALALWVKFKIEMIKYRKDQKNSK